MNRTILSKQISGTMIDELKNNTQAFWRLKNKLLWQT